MQVRHLCYIQTVLSGEDTLKVVMRVPEVVKMGKVDSRGFFDDEFIDGQVSGRWNLRQAQAGRLPFRDNPGILHPALLGAVFAE